MNKNNIDYKEIIAPIIDFYKKYQYWILGIGGGILFIIFFSLFVIGRIKDVHRRAQEKIVIAESYIYQRMYTEGFKLLDEIISNYKNSKYAGYAMYLKASALYQQEENFQEIKNLCLKILQIKKPKSVIPFTMFLLAQTYTNLQEHKNAIDTYNEFIKLYPNHFLTPKVYESLAITYESINDIQNAKNVYDKMNILYPGSYWSNLAQKKLSSL